MTRQHRLAKSYNEENLSDLTDKSVLLLTVGNIQNTNTHLVFYSVADNCDRHLLKKIRLVALRIWELF